MDIDISEVCNQIEDASDKFDVPAPLIARLLWFESNFDAQSVDSQGRMGIAKVPANLAAAYRVRDPFDSFEAVEFMAAYLATERRHLGNFGLAVAAYDVGEDRVTNRGQPLPWQTKNLVFEATGYPASTFFDGRPAPDMTPLATDTSFLDACQSIPKDKWAEQVRVSREHKWSAIVAGGWSRELVVRQWMAFSKRHDQAARGLTPSIQRWVSPLGRAGVYAAKIYTNGRSEADQICARLHRAGGLCIVLRN